MYCHPFTIREKERAHLGQRSKAVGSAAGIGNNVEIRLVLLLIDTHNKHGSILTRSRNNNLLCTTLGSNHKTK
jgi:hypothetical protein